jgi:hypothetical protein
MRVSRYVMYSMYRVALINPLGVALYKAPEGPISLYAVLGRVVLYIIIGGRTFPSALKQISAVMCSPATWLLW